MAIDWLGQAGNAGTIVVGFIGIYVALRNQQRQLHAQMFIEMSGRFQELLRLFPSEAWLANRNPSQPMPTASQEITDCTLYALQFIADIYLLHEGGLIPDKLWDVWERAIRKTLSGRVFRREWPALAAEFEFTQNFVSYINSSMQEKSDRLLPRPS
jgi:hypothetical protein